jgi:hypothetical protein
MTDLLIGTPVRALVLLAAICGVTGYSTSAASGVISLERIAFQFSGSSCHAQHENLSSALRSVPGLRGIDLASIPDHLLVDIDPQVLSNQDLFAIVTRAVTSTGCLVKPMRSCISAATSGSIRKP